MDIYGSMWGPNEFTCTGNLKHWDRVADLPRIRQPSLVLCGLHDELTPDSAARIHRGLPHSELKVFKNSSHMPVLRRAGGLFQNAARLPRQASGRTGKDKGEAAQGLLKVAVRHREPQAKHRERDMQRRIFLQGAASLPNLGREAFAADKKVLRIGMNAEVLTLDPIKTVYGPDIITQGVMFARLRRADAQRKELFPALAELDISDDGKTYTFQLREAKFSDGSPITAEDVAPSAIRECAGRRIRPMPDRSSRWTRRRPPVRRPWSCI